jgi:hypothetical protein
LGMLGGNMSRPCSQVPPSSDGGCSRVSMAIPPSAYGAG